MPKWICSRARRHVQHLELSHLTQIFEQLFKLVEIVSAMLRKNNDRNAVTNRHDQQIEFDQYWFNSNSLLAGLMYYMNLQKLQGLLRTLKHFRAWQNKSRLWDLRIQFSAKNRHFHWSKKLSTKRFNPTLKRSCSEWAEQRTYYIIVDYKWKYIVQSNKKGTNHSEWVIIHRAYSIAFLQRPIHTTVCWCTYIVNISNLARMLQRLIVVFSECLCVYINFDTMHAVVWNIFLI